MCCAGSLQGQTVTGTPDPDVVCSRATPAAVLCSANPPPEPRRLQPWLILVAAVSESGRSSMSQVADVRHILVKALPSSNVPRHEKNWQPHCLCFGAYRFPGHFPFSRLVRRHRVKHAAMALRGQEFKIERRNVVSPTHATFKLLLVYDDVPQYVLKFRRIDQA